MSKEQKLTVYIFLGLSLVSIFIFIFFKNENKTYLDFISIWGSFASLSAFVFLFFQIKSQKVLTEESNNTIKETKDLLIKLFSISDISKGTKIVEQAQTFLRLSKFESALLRLKDLKEILIYIKHYNTKENLINLDEYADHVSNISIDLLNINDKIIGKKSTINVSKIISNLEEVSTFISDFELKIKDNDS
ncbi:hypothetical protein [Maribacter dokdonensis]|uniref:hypothetical protein n=1 Tax=Maribacter dokdonensis TaxID=320912 RepID=UPI00328B2455